MATTADLAAAATPGSKQAKAYLATTGGTKCVLPFAPREVDHAGWADDWSTLARPGRSPLVLRAGDGLATMSFTALLAGRDHQTSVEPYLSALRSIAASSATCSVSLGPSESGAWVMTDCKVHSTMRQAGTNAITRAEVTLSFSRVSTTAVKSGPVTGSQPKPKTSKRAALWYTVKKGDTLAKIAVRYFGDADDWRIIANHANNKTALRNPNRLAVGQRIYIPAA
jgi:nucleoid-associated protein YgaU